MKSFQPEYSVARHAFGLVACLSFMLNAQADVSWFSSLTAIDIGSPDVNGRLEPGPNSVQLSSHGTNFNGSSDQFTFAYQKCAGDFDLRVRVMAVQQVDVWAKAAFMVRESLEANSRFAAVTATPSLSGCFFQNRSTTGAAAASQGGLPVNHPYTWLRLKRTGSLVEGFAGWDGTSWRALGSSSQEMPADAYVGLAAARGGKAQEVQTQFADWGAVRDGTNVLWSLPRESLGPSSRKTGLAISEIMYNPGSWANGANLAFVELFNANPFPEDISGYRLSGAIEYVFPEGTTLPGGGFLVAAAEPEDVKAYYGITAVAGPFRGALGSAGKLRLQNAVGSVYLEIPYDSRSPWPVGAHGTGHSLVLARPSYGEADPRAWDASGDLGGSPGAVDGWRGGPLTQVKINELLVNTRAAQQGFVELYNHANTPVDLSGCWLGPDPGTNKFHVPSGTVIAAGGFIGFGKTELGLAAGSGGERLFLISPDLHQILDAVECGAQAAGVSVGRYPDGADDFYALEQPTSGAANAPIRKAEVVINEIMYHPISNDKDDQYLELHNPGETAVELGGWRLAAGVDFNFAPGTVIPPGGYLVVARNATQLRTHYDYLTAANTVGNFQGSLSGKGARVALVRPERVMDNSNGQTNELYVVVDEVTYGTGGRWGRWSDGGGSSLELVDARSNRRCAANWADSDESHKAGWTAIEATGVLTNGSTAIESLHLLLLGEGECLVDNVELRLAENSTNLIANPDFETGLSNWNVQGDHIQSSLESGEGYQSGQSLHLRASNQGDTGPNRVRGVLAKGASLRAGQTVTLRAQVRWLCGFPEILLRVKGNYLEAFGRLEVPRNLGTPGLPNSRKLDNVGPALTLVKHDPVLPAANQEAVVTASAQDPDGLGNLSLFYRLDAQTNYTPIPMVDDGGGADAVAGDGIFSAVIPAQPAGALVAFYIEAADAAGTPALTHFPNDAPARECLVRFGDPMPASSFGTYRLWLSGKTVKAWTARPVLSNEDLDGTFVYGQERAVYNIGARLTGSPFHQGGYNSPTGPPCSYSMSMPKDNPVLGAVSFNKLHTPGNTPGDDATIQHEQIAYWMVRQLGLPWNYQRYVNMFVNGNRRGTLMEDTQVPASDVIQELYPDDDRGDLYKLSGWFEFDFGTGTALNFPFYSWCALNDVRGSDGQKRPADYRWNFLPRAVQDSANDYRDLFALIDAANPPAAAPYGENLDTLADMDQWLRTFAIEHAVGNWDSFGNRNAQNMFMYKPTQGRWQLIIWDFNIVLGNSGSDGPAGDNLLQRNYADRAMSRIYAHPPYLRAYLRALQEIANGPMSNAKIDAILDARFAAFRANGLAVSSPAPIKTWARARQSYLRNYLTNLTVGFSVTSPEAAAIATNQNWVTISGVAPLELETIKFNGSEYPLTWTSPLEWTARVPLAQTTNALVIQGYDHRKQPVESAQIVRTVVNTQPLEPAARCVVINEIMHHPAVPGAEYVELCNPSEHSIYDLTGCRLRGVDFNFTSGTLLGPGEYLVVVRDRAIFTAAYGGLARVAGEYQGTLNSSGETLRLLKLGAQDGSELLIDEVTYGVASPWPAAAAGSGASLQLRDPLGDNNRPGNWGAVSPEQAAHPDWRFRQVTGAASNSTLLIYLGPLQVPPDPHDISGQWDGTIGFSGAPYRMTVMIRSLSSNQWTGDFIGQDVSTPLGSVKYASNKVSFAFPPEFGPVRWDGRLSDDGQSITGTFSQTAQGQTTTAPFSLTRYVDPAVRLGGDLYLDDVKLVLGTNPSEGQNLIHNGDFEMSLAGSWNLASNHLATCVSTELKHSGNSSLHLIASRGGDGLDSAVWQVTEPILAGQVYTLSYWYLPSTNGHELTVRLGDASINSTHAFAPDQPATPGLPNNITQTKPRIVINEWMANNSGVVIDPDGLRGGDWIELYNSGPQRVDLSGYFLTDQLANKTQWAVPQGIQIEPNGFLVIWADDKTQYNRTGKALHANFKLDQNGEAIGLYSPDGELVDAVVFGDQPVNISQGCWPDGNQNQVEMLTAPTPGARNVWAAAGTELVLATTIQVDSNRVVTLKWRSQLNRRYQVQYRDRCEVPQWADAGASVTASGEHATWTSPAAVTVPMRFFRVLPLQP
jgi:hypothetical protein